MEGWGVGGGGCTENANPAEAFFPQLSLSSVSYPLMQNMELKELIRMYAEMGKCEARRKK